MEYEVQPYGHGYVVRRVTHNDVRFADGNGAWHPHVLTAGRHPFSSREAAQDFVKDQEAPPPAIQAGEEALDAWVDAEGE